MLPLRSWSPSGTLTHYGFGQQLHVQRLRILQLEYRQRRIEQKLHASQLQVGHISAKKKRATGESRDARVL